VPANDLKLEMGDLRGWPGMVEYVVMSTAIQYPGISREELLFRSVSILKGFFRSLLTEHSQDGPTMLQVIDDLQKSDTIVYEVSDEDAATWIRAFKDRLGHEEPDEESLDEDNIFQE